MYSIFDSPIGLNKWLQKGNADVLSPEGNALGGINSSIGLVGGGVASTDPNTLGSGEAASILAYAKLNFTDTSEGWMQGLDTDNKYKWVIGGASNYIDWGITTASTLTVVGTISGSVVIGGEIHVPDIDTTANSFHVNTAGSMWLGCTETDFDSNNENANAYILNTGVAKFTTVSLMGSLNISTSGNIKSGQTAYNTGTGYFIEYNAGSPRFSIGNPAGEYVTWDASNLTIKGVLISTAATIDGTDTDTFTINDDSDDVTAQLIFGRTTGGDATVGWNGSEINIDQPIHLTSTSAQLQLHYDAGNYSTFTVGSGGNLTVAPTGDFIFDPVGNDILPTTGYDLNLGSIQKKYLTLHAAELWVETLVAQDTIATIGGRILVGPTTALTSDLADDATTIYVKHNQMASGDRVYMEADSKVEFMSIDSAAGGAGPYSYTVTRNLDGSGANAWYAGDAMFNTGAAGDGFIDIYSLSGVISGSGPTIAGNVRNSATYNDWTTHWAIGELNGVYGYGATTYGVAFGEYAASKAHMTLDSTNGLRIFNGTATVLGQWDVSGNITVGQVGASQSNVYITSGALSLRNNTTAKIVLAADGTAYFAGAITVGDGTTTSGTVTLNHYATGGDTYFGGGTFTASTWTCNNGFLMGIDDSDSDKLKFYLGDGSSWMDWNVTTADTLTIAGTLSVGTVGIQNLLDNGDLEDWTDGVNVAPDDWALANGAVARSATHKIGTYSAALTRSGVDTALTEEFHADKGIAYWQGRTVTLSIWVQASDANVTIKIQDSVGRTDSSAHTGGGDWELLTVSRTIEAAATWAKAGGQILSTNQTAYFDGAMLVEGTSPMPFSPKYRDWGQAGNYTEIDGGNISVTSSISINDATWQNQGIQLQYNAGTPRLYVGDGANKYFQFDGTDASVGSDSLINTTPAGTIESRANSLFEDKAFIGNYNDGIPETTGGGSTITRDLVTTTLVGSFGAAGLLSAEFGLVYFADSFEIIMQAKEVATVEAGRFGVSSEGTRHAYFWFDGGALKASSTDDDGNTATTITGITTTNWNTYRIVFDAGTSIKFYVNDILKATHDYTSASDRWLKFYFMASEAAGDSTLYITNNYTIFADI